MKCLLCGRQPSLPCAVQGLEAEMGKARRVAASGHSLGQEGTGYT